MTDLNGGPSGAIPQLWGRTSQSAPPLFHPRPHRPSPGGPLAFARPEPPLPCFPGVSPVTSTLPCLFMVPQQCQANLLQMHVTRPASRALPLARNETCKRNREYHNQDHNRTAIYCDQFVGTTRFVHLTQEL